MAKFFAKTSQKLREKMSKDADKTLYDKAHQENEKQYNIVKKLLTQMDHRVTKLMKPNSGVPRIPGMHRKKPSSAPSEATGGPPKSDYAYEHGQLADAIREPAKELDERSMFSRALNELTGALDKALLADYALEAKVSQQMVDPITKKMKKGGEFEEIDHLIKKLEGRRLLYDDTRGKHSKGKSSVTDSDVEAAENRFVETKQKCDERFRSFFADDPERTAMLLEFIQAECEYHQECYRSFSQLEQNVQQIMENPDEAFSEKVGGTLVEGGGAAEFADSDDDVAPGTYDSTSASASVPENTAGASTAACALYDFEAEQEGELSFKEGDQITLIAKLDDNWLEGSTAGGQHGIFPIQYVEAGPGVIDSLPVPPQ